MSDFYTSMNSPVGPLTLFEDQGALTALEWGRAPASRSTPLLNEATRQLTAYFDGGLRNFDLPLTPVGGTEYQQRVWQAMRDIPYGHTETYGDLAARIDGVARAVGGACGANPLPILIPCHRVTGAGGRMT
ncbi:MAG TPA: cysteine methyltransferase, partial [Rhodospirillaceae bacterium]|nr:cysteine methyltransferase [Rhodospirillaceae bacterium]